MEIIGLLMVNAMKIPNVPRAAIKELLDMVPIASTMAIHTKVLRMRARITETVYPEPTSTCVGSRTKPGSSVSISIMPWFSCFCLRSVISTTTFYEMSCLELKDCYV